MKEPKCSFCGEPGHYKINCFKAPRAPIKSAVKELKRSPIKRSATKSSIYTSKPKPRLKTSLNRRKELVKELDRVFSLYIRMKAAINGVARCVTCGDKDSWKLMDCGHFIVRGKVGTRWDEQNCHVQCRRCNRVNQGNIKRYKLFLQARYGREIIDILKKRSKNRVETYEIEAMIKIYKKKVLLYK